MAYSTGNIFSGLSVCISLCGVRDTYHIAPLMIPLSVKLLFLQPMENCLLQMYGFFILIRFIE